MRIRKAAKGRPVVQRPQAYPSQPPMSTPLSPRVPPKRELRKPGRPGLRESLGLLLLGLQGTRLSVTQRRRAYDLVARWTAQLVDARIAAEAM